MMNEQSSGDGAEGARMVLREDWKAKDVGDSEGSKERLLVGRV